MKVGVISENFPLFQKRKWINELGNWVKTKIELLIKKHSYLTLKLNYENKKNKVFDEERNSNTFDIVFKNSRSKLSSKNDTWSRKKWKKQKEVNRTWKKQIREKFMRITRGSAKT